MENLLFINMFWKLNQHTYKQVDINNDINYTWLYNYSQIDDKNSFKKILEMHLYHSFQK